MIDHPILRPGETITGALKRQDAEIDSLRLHKRAQAEDIMTLGQEIGRLRAALSSSASWLERWAKHVGNCEGLSKCTCGLTAVLYEANAALVHEQKGNDDA